MGARLNYPLIGALSVFTFVILATANAMIVPLDPAAVCETKLCIIVRTFSEYQTLTGAGLAIIAAFVAARPAWLQLQKMKLQQDIAARSAIVSRLKGIEGRARYMEKEVDSLLREIMNHLYDFDDEGEFGNASTPVDPQWAHNMSSQCLSIASKLETHQKLMRDTHRIETARQNVILALKALDDCLDGISLYARTKYEPEISSSQREECRRCLRPTGFQLDGLKFHGRSSSIRLFGWPPAMASRVALR